MLPLLQSTYKLVSPDMLRKIASTYPNINNNLLEKKRFSIKENLVKEEYKLIDAAKEGKYELSIATGQNKEECEVFNHLSNLLEADSDLKGFKFSNKYIPQSNKQKCNLYISWEGFHLEYMRLSDEYEKNTDVLSLYSNNNYLIIIKYFLICYKWLKIQTR